MLAKSKWHKLPPSGRPYGKAAKAPSAPSVAWRRTTTFRIVSCRVPSYRRFMRFVEDVATRYDIIIANVFHAGDGNLHPNLLFDVRDGDQVQRVIAAGEEIIRACIDAGGSLSGEHGIGTEKQEYMDWLYGEEDLEAMRKLKRAFDPDWLFNPSQGVPHR